MKSWQLLFRKDFAPYYFAMILGAFNDNFYKNALVLFITFQLSEQLGAASGILVAASAGIFIFPYFLFSARAGSLSDESEASKYIQKIKLLEIVIMGLGAVGFILKAPYFLILVLFGMGTQSTFYGPIKYAILPDLVKKEELVSANTVVEAGTFLSILLGTIAGGIAIALEGAIAYVCIGVLLFAFLGWICSLYIPKVPPKVKKTKKDNFMVETLRIVRIAQKTPKVIDAIYSISWFWLIGAVLLSLFPLYAKDVFGGGEFLVNVFLASFSIGIGIGSTLYELLSKGKINMKLSSIGFLGMTVSLAALYFIDPSSDYKGLLHFFTSSLENLVLMFLLLLFSICGGLMIVPLYTQMQTESVPEERSRVIAANNILNAIFMVGGAIVNSLLIAFEFAIPQIFLVFAVLQLLFYYFFFKPKIDKGEL